MVFLKDEQNEKITFTADERKRFFSFDCTNIYEDNEDDDWIEEELRRKFYAGELWDIDEEVTQDEQPYVVSVEEEDEKLNNSKTSASKWKWK